MPIPAPGGAQPPSTNSYLEWAKAILTGLGYEDQPNSEIALVCWMVKEGGTSGGSSNPLNTKQPGKGKQLANGVWAYDDNNAGLDATVKTLKNGYYNAIIAALKANRDYVTTCRYVDSSVWGTKGATTVAVSVKASGGASGALYKGYARTQVPTAGHSLLRDIPVVGGAIADTSNAVGAVGDALGSVGSFLGVLTDPHTWYRVGQVLFGAILVGLGFYAIARNTSVAQAAMGAAGSVKGKRGKTGGAVAPKAGTELEVAAA
jgi:hypothetical protein